MSEPDLPEPIPVEMASLQQGPAAQGPSPVRFGEVAIEQGFLTEEQLEQLLHRQHQLEDMGLPQRLDEIAVEMGVLASVDRDFILSVLKKRRGPLSAPSIPAMPAVHSGPTRPGSAEMPHILGTDPEDPIPPCRFGHFEVVERIDGVRGNFFKAYDRRLGQHVALRLMPSFLREDPGWIECFLRDAKDALRLTHPNLLTLHGAGEIEGRYYLAMEMPVGELLGNLLMTGGRFTEFDALRIARDLAYGVYHAHVLGLIVRNLCPDTVLLDPSGRGRVWDLGVGKVQTDDPRMIAAGLSYGGYEYMSPEQAHGNFAVGRRSDLYSLGATLFHMVTGHPPYTGSNPDEVRELVLNAPPPDPHTWVETLSPLTCSLIKKLMAKDPEARIKRADGIIAWIDRVFAETRPTLDDFHAASNKNTTRDADPSEPVIQEGDVEVFRFDSDDEPPLEKPQAPPMAFKPGNTGMLKRKVAGPKISIGLNKKTEPAAQEPDGDEPLMGM